jgi:hypothetical protein
VCGVSQTKSRCDGDICYPVDQVVQTYANACLMHADGARQISEGACIAGLGAGQGYWYRSIADVLDRSYLAWTYTPLQASNYTQSIIDKISNTLKVARLKPYGLKKLLRLK